MSNPNHHDALQCIFPDTMPLFDYIKFIANIDVTDSVPSSLLNRMSSSMKENLIIYYIIPPENYLHLSSHERITLPSEGEQLATMHEILFRFIDQQIRTNKDYKVQNCVTLGYRSTSIHSKASLRHNANLECFYVNTLHVYFNHPMWSLLAMRLGENVIRHLLSQPLFIKLTNGSYLQLSGTPLSHLIHSKNCKHRKNRNDTANTKLNNGSDIHNTCNNSSTYSNINADVSKFNTRLLNTEIPHRSIFYNIAYEKNLGLPRSHLFEMKNTSPQSLAVKIFGGNLIDIKKDHEQSSKFDQSDFLNVLKSILNSYRNLNISQICHRLCPVRLNPEDNDSSDRYENDDDNNDSKSNKKKFRNSFSITDTSITGTAIASNLNVNTATKTNCKKRRKRGCRAGSRRKLANPATSTTDTHKTSSVTNSCHENKMVSKRVRKRDDHDTDIETAELCCQAVLNEQNHNTNHLSKRTRTVNNGTIENLNDKHKSSSKIVLIGQRLLSKAVDGLQIAVETNRASKEYHSQELESFDERIQPLVNEHSSYLMPKTICSSSSSELLTETSATGEKDDRECSKVTEFIYDINSSCSSTNSCRNYSNSNLNNDSLHLNMSSHNPATYINNPSNRPVMINPGSNAVVAATSSSGSSSSSYHMSSLETDCGLRHQFHNRRYVTFASPSQSVTFSNTPPTPTNTNVSFATAPVVEQIATSHHFDEVVVSADDLTQQQPQSSSSSSSSSIDCVANNTIHAPDPTSRDNECHHHLASIPSLAVSSGGPSLTPTQDSRSQSAYITVFPFLDRFLPTPPTASQNYTHKPLDTLVQLDCDFKRQTMEQKSCSVKAKPMSNECLDFIAMSTPIAQVVAYIQCICKHVFPYKEVWGNRHNYNRFMSSIELYVNLNRHENITIGHVVHKMRLHAIPWLKDDTLFNRPDCHTATATTSSITATVSVPQGKIKQQIQTQKQEYFTTFVYWVFSQFINPLLANTFYITEGEGVGRQLLYFRKPAWNMLLRQQVPLQLSHNFVKIDMNATVDRWGHSKAYVPAMLEKLPSIRFIPKKKALRPITIFRNMHKMQLIKNMSSSNTMNTNNTNYATNNVNKDILSNSMLYNCLYVFKHILNSNPILSGFGVLHLSSIHSKIRKFKEMVDTQQSKTKQQTQLTQTPSQSSTKFSTQNKPMSSSSSRPKYYIASLDLEKCYDNVDTVKLYDLVKQVLKSHHNELFDNNDNNNGQRVPAAAGSKHNKAHNHDTTQKEENVIIHRYTVAHYLKSLERPVTRSVRHVTAAGNLYPIKEAVTELSKNYPNSLISDGVVYPHMCLEEVLRLLRIHLFNHVVKLPCGLGLDSGVTTQQTETSGESLKPKKSKSMTAATYSQVKGIPQGSVLSPVLCNIYYGHVERQIFGSDQSVKVLGLLDNTLILRVMDDYLAISTNENSIRYALQRIHTSYRIYGGDVNPLKTFVNFDNCHIDYRGKKINLKKIEGNELIWCGYRINTDTLEFSASLQRILDQPLKASITVATTLIGVGLRRAMKHFIRMKCHTILFDSIVNRVETVIITIYQLFLLASLRTCKYLNEMNKRDKSRLNSAHLCRAFYEAIEFGKRLVLLRINIAGKSSRVLKFGTKKVIKKNKHTRMPNSTNNDIYIYNGIANSNRNKIEGNDVKESASNSSSHKRSAENNQSKINNNERCDNHLFMKALKCTKVYSVKCDLNTQQIEWLICDAFLQVIQVNHHASKYPNLLRYLKKKVSICEQRIKKSTKINMRLILGNSNVLDILHLKE